MVETGLWWAFGVAVWWLTLSSVTLAETVLAVLACLPCAVAARAARRAAHNHWRVCGRWLGFVPVLAVSVVTDSARVLGAGLGAAARRRPLRGAVHRVPLPAASGPTGAAFRAMAVTVLSVTPASVVIGEERGDRDGGVLIVHSLAGGRPRLDEAVSR